LGASLFVEQYGVSATEAPSTPAQELSSLLEPPRFFTRTDVLGRPSAVPASPGVYAWYFDQPPPGVPLTGCHFTNDQVLLYVGISPKAPSLIGGPPSRQTLRSRLRYHYKGNAAGSTLRLTLGCLLTEALGIQLRRVGSGERLTFGPGEAAISAWMEQHARVCWTTTNKPWLLETQLIRQISLPLNLDQNTNSQFRADLSAIRAARRSVARKLPILPSERSKPRPVAARESVQT
jgi:hypothetical protein